MMDVAAEAAEIEEILTAMRVQPVEYYFSRAQRRPTPPAQADSDPYSTMDVVQRAKALSPALQVDLAIRLAQDGGEDATGIKHAYVLGALLRQKLSFSQQQVAELLSAVKPWRYCEPLAGALRAAERVELTDGIRATLRELLDHRWLASGYADAEKTKKRIEEMLGVREAPPALTPKGEWSRRVFPAAAGHPGAVALVPLLFRGEAFSGVKPPKKWLAETEEAIGRVGRGEFRRVALEWLELAPFPGKAEQPVAPEEGDLQRGFVWTLVSFADAEMCAALGRLTERCFRKIPNFGPVAPKTGNAAVNALAAMDSMDAVGQLSRLASTVKYSTAQRLIARALEQAASRTGLSREQIEEISIPTCGLGADGKRRVRLGAYWAEFDRDDTTVSFANSAGKRLSSVPAAIRTEHADELKSVRKGAKDAAAMLTGQRLRIERLLLTQREIGYETWRRQYLEHPLLGGLARRLIWSFRWNGQTIQAIWHEDALVEWNGVPVEPLEDASVVLWHPCHADTGTVLSWRCWLEDNRVRQPFKQAHREVYRLTEAERQTETHSNRFAAHILRQHQFAALAEQRGWKYTLMGAWDSHNTPTLELPQFGLTVEYLVDEGADSELSYHAIYLHVVTNQVRFVSAEAPHGVVLETIPSHVFSEVMRDVDLFVGVSSVGADPTWEPGRFRDLDVYWSEYSFGDLSGSAQSRREVVEALLPKLPIRERCSMDDRFLVVRGERATYKIHFGSGNVLMEPGSRYLCIVRGPSSAGGADKVFLPFEGDTTLSMILSKAFLLANDLKITDGSILAQIQAR